MSEAAILMIVLIFVLAYLIVGIVRRNHDMSLPPPILTRTPPKSETNEPKELKFRKLYDIYTLPPPKAIPSDEALGIVRPQPGSFIAKPCEHRSVPRAFSYTVFGYDVRVPHVTRCPDCMQALLETFFERCAECGRGIPSGGRVAISWIGAPQPYTHLECAESPLLFCGIWEYGRLLTLNEISDEFNPGVATVMEDSEIDLAREAKPPEPEEKEEAEGEETEATNPAGSAKPDMN